jgi:subtilase family serine protease
MKILRIAAMAGAFGIVALTSSPAFSQATQANIPSAANTGNSFIEGTRPPQGYARPPFHVRPNANTATPSGMTPANVQRTYGFDQIANQGEGMVVAIIDAFDHPNIESDLNVFSTTFGLPPCTTANGCFQKIFANGKPRTDAGWALEISLDVEWIHAIAPKAKILLVEARTNSFADLLAAVDVAVKNNAKVVSMSFGGSEFGGETGYDSHFNIAGVSFVASSGDSGNGAEYPAASPYVVAVGGTTLNADVYGNYIGETAWSGSGGGISAYEAQPSGQTNWPLPYPGKRGIPDVAYNGNPNTGFAVYDSVKYQGQAGWFQVGGTSAGAPQWAALLAIANSLRTASGKPTLSATYDTLYTIGKSAYGTAYYDISTGQNGSCGTVCSASGSYDYVTGLGAPRANNLIQLLAGF